MAVSSYDSHRELAYDVALDNQELREQIKQLKSKLTEEKRLRLKAQIDRRFMADKLEANGINHSIPCYVDEGEIECSAAECYASLREDDTFCPGCGKWIDWAHAENKSVTRPLGGDA